MGKILKVKDGITWEEFKAQYRKFFPVSSVRGAEIAMAREFERLTGRNPYELKAKKQRRGSKDKKESTPEGAE